MVDVDTTIREVNGLLPVDAVVWHGKPSIEWLDMTGIQFSEPFFNQTVARVRTHGTVEPIISGFEELIRAEKSVDYLDPSGFIFHSSRCGSTLVANACRCLNGAIVISEAPVVEKLISRFFTDLDDTGTKELLYSAILRAAVRLLGQRRLGNETRYFIKFSAVSILQFDRIRRVWPNVPAVILYRDPVEVMVSNLRNVPDWMRPESNPKTAAALVDVAESNLSMLGPAEFCARALGRFYSAAASAVDNKTLLCNYRRLSEDTFMRLVEFFGISISNEEADAIRKAIQVYSKDPSLPFESDSASKRDGASDLIKQMAEKWAREPYDILMSLEQTL